MNDSRPVTIIEVAKEAGVSTATVSNVLNRRNVPLSEETIRKVEGAAARLGYRRNGMAASLSRRKSNELGLLLPGFSGYYGEFADHMERTAHANGYQLLTFSTSLDPNIEKRQLEMLLERRVDGIVCHGLAMKPDSIRALIGEGTPIVLFNAWEVPEGLGIGAVNLDLFRACMEAVRHLYEQGCRSFAYLGSPTPTATDRQRRSGFFAGIDKLPEGKVLAQAIETTAADWMKLPGQAAANRHEAAPVGILGFDDRVAFTFMSEVLRQGFAVPGEFRIVGINNEFVARSCHPGLTSIDIPYEEQVETVLRWLLLRLGEEESGNAGDRRFEPPPHGCREINIPLRLVVRQSSGG